MQHLVDTYMVEMQTAWDYRLIALSVAIAIIGSFVALDFAGRMKSAQGNYRKLWFAGGALMMGLAIWSMHFVGMLALIMPMPMQYDTMLMVLSILAAIVGSAIAFAIMNRQHLDRIHLLTGSIAMGLAISTMHYLGMASMQMPMIIRYNPALFALSIAIAVSASAAALWIAFRMQQDKAAVWFWHKLGSAIVMGFAISGMHYTGMLAAHYYHAGHVQAAFMAVPMAAGIVKLSDLMIVAAVIFGAALLLLSSQIAGERQRALQLAQKSLEREKLTSDTINSIRSEIDLDTILQQTVNRIGQFLQADRCTIWLYNSYTEEFAPSSHEYRSNPRVMPTQESAFPQRAVFSSTLGHMDVLNIPDVLQAKCLTEDDRRVIQERSIQSLLHVPILYKSQLLGSIRVHAIQKQRDWDPETVALIKHIADQVALAIYQAKTLQELRDSEARKTGLLETSLDAIITMDHTGRVREWNASAERILGYKRKEVIGQEMTLLIIPEQYREAHKKGLARYLATGEGPMLNKMVEVSALRSDGMEFPCELTITRIPTSGKPMFTGTLRDITERRQTADALERKVAERTAQLETANAALRVTEERFRLLVETVKDYAIYRLDPNGIIQTWNEGAERIKGYRAEEVIGQHISKFYTPEALQDDYPAYELKMAREQGRFEDESWRIRKDGSKFWANVVVTALYDEHGELSGFTKITRDLTERKRAEEELRELADTLQRQSSQLEAVNKELEAFSYSVSHDLRAPLRAIDGFSEAVYNDYADKLDDTAKRYLTRVRQGSQQMAQLIDDMLNLSRLSRGTLNIEADVDLSQIARDIAAELHREEPERQVDFVIEGGITAPGDKRLLQTVMQNLLGNAWKYTSKHATARIEFGKLENGKTIYYVKDDGAGFNMQYADKLFGAFQRLHKASEFSGMGVGLATVARIIHRHGGQVWADSEIEHGATFYFTLEPVLEPEKEDGDVQNQQPHDFVSGR